MEIIMNRIFFSLILLTVLPVFLFSQKENGKEEDSLKVYTVPSITVSTNRVEENKSPVPFSEITESDIQMKYTNEDVPQFMKGLPSIHVYSYNGNNIGYSELNMRGFDQRRISVMINGVPQNDPEDHNVYWIDFPDLAESLENIQIQRGAGISTYGAAAIGGSINLQTSNFTQRQKLKISTGLGWQEYASSGDTKYEQAMSKYMAEFSSGMVGDYAFYGRLSKVNTIGYRDRSWANLNSFFFSGARFDDNFTTQINIFGGPLRDGLVYNGLPKKWVDDLAKRRKNLAYAGFAYDSTGRNILYTTERRPQEEEYFSQPHYELLNDWQINENIALKSTLFYYTGDGYFDYDESWAGPEQFRLKPEYGYDTTLSPERAIVRAYVGNKHGGWIPRLVLDHKRGTFTAGAEIRLHRSDHWGKILHAANLPSDLNPDYKFYSYDGVRDIFSLFVSEQYELSDELLVSAELQGVRHTYAIENEKKGKVYAKYLSGEVGGGIDTVSGGGRLFTTVWWFLNPRLGATWNYKENMRVYGSAAFTQRDPRMKNLYNASSAYWGDKPLFESDTLEDGTDVYDFSNPIVKSEKMLDLELGWNYRDERYNFRVNGFWMEYFDELVKSGKVDIHGEPIDGNAPRSRHAGIELQGTALLLEGKYGKLKLHANSTISRNEIIEYNYLLGKENGRDITVPLGGNSIAGFPDFMANFGFSYQYKNAYISLDGHHIGEYRTDSFGDMLQNNQTLINHLQNKGTYYYDNVLEPYTVMNLDLAYTIENVFKFRKLRFHLRVNNLLNEIYAAGAEGMEFFPGAERNVFMNVDFEF